MFSSSFYFSENTFRVKDVVCDLTFGGFQMILKSKVLNSYIFHKNVHDVYMFNLTLNQIYL